MTQRTILIVDDQPDMLGFLERFLNAELGVSVRCAANADQALALLAQAPVDVVLTDIRMPGMDGLELLKRLKGANPEAMVIIMTAYGSIEKAVEALKLGAYDFITKPFDESHLLHVIGKALEHASLRRRTQDLEKQIRDHETVAHFIGRSAPVTKLVETLRLVARTDVTVLITGETGTGKELAARMIHALSPRAAGPLIMVNCPAIPEDILESELFGYRKGAFTGALSDRAGLFASAEGGSIVLDEISDMSPLLQTKLLRVLQEKELRPLGDDRTRKIDVRVIASTNQDPRGKISCGQFREDLYHRLNCVTIHTPALREMAEDIPLLANHFLARYCAEFGADKKLAADAMRELAAREWSGNVRELQNTIKRAIIFSRQATITAADLASEACRPPEAGGANAAFAHCKYREAKNSVLKEFNTRYIESLLRETEGNVSQAAKQAGLERQSLQHLMKKYAISPETFRKGAK